MSLSVSCRAYVFYIRPNKIVRQGFARETDHLMSYFVKKILVDQEKQICFIFVPGMFLRCNIVELAVCASSFSSFHAVAFF